MISQGTKENVLNLTNITELLIKCLKKGAVIKINDAKYINYFNTCRNLLIAQPTLQYSYFTKSFNLITDARNFAIGVILSQDPIDSDFSAA